MNCKAYELIPRNEYYRVMRSGDTDLSRDFMCFEENYIPLVPFIPNDWVVVDLGCYQAAQAYFFTEKGGYVGVDIYDGVRKRGYKPPLRFKPQNAVHVTETIQQFVREHLCYFDLDKTYFIMSGVKDFDATREAFAKVKHAYRAYPGTEPAAKGINSKEILEAVRKYKLQQDIEELLARIEKDPA